MAHLIEVLAVDEQDHQQGGDINFYGSHEQEEFAINLEAADYQQEMQQMIGKT